MKIDVAELEIAITSWIAHNCGLVEDEEIFPCSLPSQFPTGTCVRITGEVTDNLPHIKEYSAQIAGKYYTPAAAWRMQELITNLFGAWSVRAGKYLLAELLASGTAAVFSNPDDGGETWLLSLNFYVRARALTTSELSNSKQ